MLGKQRARLLDQPSSQRAKIKRRGLDAQLPKLKPRDIEQRRDEAILEARRWLWREHRLVVETGAAAPVAALMTGAYRADEGERLAVVLCGANTDPSDL